MIANVFFPLVAHDNCGDCPDRAATGLPQVPQSDDLRLHHIRSIHSIRHMASIILCRSTKYTLLLPASMLIKPLK